MKKLACRYAIVQFVPYAETGEFANIGIVLACPQTGYFDFKLQTRRYKRVTSFFSELDGSFYRDTAKAIEGELARIKDQALRLDGFERADALRHLFTELLHPREAIVRFGDARAILTDEPQQTLISLFDHYVDHDFATKEYVENTMTRRLQKLLSSLRLVAPFRPARLGDDVVHANFQLVQRQDDRPIKLIKAFNLGQKDPNAIYAHGDIWVPRMKRLRERGFLPEKTLFTVALPSPSDTKRYGASQEVLSSLRAASIQVELQQAEDRIRDFVQAH